MSITISTCDEISGSPMNTSKAKMLYSFPKGERLQKTKGYLYKFVYLDVISSMILTLISPKLQGLHHSDLAISMIFPKPLDVRLLVILIT